MLLLLLLAAERVGLLRTLLRLLALLLLLLLPVGFLLMQRGMVFLLGDFLQFLVLHVLDLVRGDLRWQLWRCLHRKRLLSRFLLT